MHTPDGLIANQQQELWTELANLCKEGRGMKDGSGRTSSERLSDNCAAPADEARRATA
jgi:hypothetical protein